MIILLGLLLLHLEELEDKTLELKLSDATEKELESFGYNVDDVIMNLQKNLLQGDLTLPEGLKRESFVDD